LSPEEAAKRLAREALRGPVVLLFGGEQRGLSDEDLERCHDIAVIPTSEIQPSMNLGQSVAVMLYLCSREMGSVVPAEAAEMTPSESGAHLRLLYALEEKMMDVLLRSEFLNPEAPEHVLRELGRSLVRSRLTQREAELWMSAFTHLARHVRR
jgi:tRNA/rRNA methyltransferase